MNTHTRRRFLRGLGLGAGATMLMPISDRLIGRALGQTSRAPKRLLLLSVYMMEPTNRTPEGVGISGSERRESIAPFVPQRWPAMFDPLGRYMNQAVFIDGARIKAGTIQHRSGAIALSARTLAEGNGERMGPANGPTIDHFIGDTLSAGRPFRAINWSLAGDRLEGGTGSGIFARARQANVQHYDGSASLHVGVFNGQLQGGGGGVNAFRPLRDRLVADLERLRSRLASEERIGLETYEAAVVAYDERQEALAQIRCETPSTPGERAGGDALIAEVEFEAMMEQSLLALQCGLTNVVAASLGTSGNHNRHDPLYQSAVAAHSNPEEAGHYGHGGGKEPNRSHRLEYRRLHHQVHLRQVARVLDALALATDEDGSSMLDNTAVAYVSGNPGMDTTHHAPKDTDGSWPVLLVGGRNVGLRTGGRWMSASRHQWHGERLWLTDVYKALALSLGVDPNGFGDPERSNGPYEPLLA